MFERNFLNVYWKDRKIFDSSPKAENAIKSIIVQLNLVNNNKFRRGGNNFSIPLFSTSTCYWDLYIYRFILILSIYCNIVLHQWMIFVGSLLSSMLINVDSWCLNLSSVGTNFKAFVILNWFLLGWWVSMTFLSTNICIYVQLAVLIFTNIYQPKASMSASFMVCIVLWYIGLYYGFLFKITV